MVTYSTVYIIVSATRILVNTQCQRKLYCNSRTRMYTLIISNIANRKCLPCVVVTNLLIKLHICVVLQQAKP